ncbi:cobalamin B12-binding domain-containing protein [Paenibacillus lemnae]|uniref:Cobalamin-binding protein n=1 Tax=Paenibacillus lemnae TaxID=1330551 RepID=A0A848MDJ4_PAELE|nr:cobalamin-dependent protein [Paenibacillus lemnae]NMO98112.1 cobalamin-binding protein [Paenibacillus lemnae]
MEIEHMAELMLSGSTEACWSKVISCIEAGRNSLYIYDQLLTPAMRYVGSLWEQNLITVAEEHLASGVCDTLIARYGFMVKPEQGHGRRAMFLCVEDEHHDLGIKMAASLFQEQGFDTRFYGRNLPLEAAMLSAMNWKPEVIGLSASIVYHLPKLKDYVEGLKSLSYRPDIVVGGRLIERYGIQETLGDRALFFPDLLQLNHWLMHYGAAETEVLYQNMG